MDGLKAAFANLLVLVEVGPRVIHGFETAPRLQLLAQPSTRLDQPRIPGDPGWALTPSFRPPVVLLLSSPHFSTRALYSPFEH